MFVCARCIFVDDFFFLFFLFFFFLFLPGSFKKVHFCDDLTNNHVFCARVLQKGVFLRSFDEHRNFLSLKVGLVKSKYSFLRFWDLLSVRECIERERERETWLKYV